MERYTHTSGSLGSFINNNDISNQSSNFGKQASTSKSRGMNIQDDDEVSKSEQTFGDMKAYETKGGKVTR
jgi:hypothetical protein